MSFRATFSNNRSRTVKKHNLKIKITKGVQLHRNTLSIEMTNIKIKFQFKFKFKSQFEDLKPFLQANFHFEHHSNQSKAITKLFPTPSIYIYTYNNQSDFN